MAAPKVTCIIPTRNRHEQLREAVASVLFTGYQPIEIIIVDAGSHPPVSVPNLPFDSRCIRLISGPSCNGAVARNLGLREASGDYVCFLDDDDEILPDKFSLLVSILESERSYDAAAGGIIAVDCEKNERCYRSNKDFSRLGNTIKNKIHNNATLIRTNIARKILFNETLDKFQDTQFNTDLVYVYNVVHVDAPVATWVYHEPSKQVSAKRGQFHCMKNYLKLIRHLVVSTRVPFYLLYNHAAILLYYFLRRW